MWCMSGSILAGEESHHDWVHVADMHPMWLLFSAAMMSCRPVGDFHLAMKSDRTNSGRHVSVTMMTGDEVLEEDIFVEAIE